MTAILGRYLLSMTDTTIIATRDWLQLLVVTGYNFYAIWRAARTKSKIERLVAIQTIILSWAFMRYMH